MILGRTLAVSALLFLAPALANAEIEVDPIARNVAASQDRFFYIREHNSHRILDASSISYYFTNEADPSAEALIKDYASLLGDSHGVLISSEVSGKRLLRILEMSSCKIPPAPGWPVLVLENRRTNVCYLFPIGNRNVLELLVILVRELEDGLDDPGIKKLELGWKTKNIADGYIDQYQVLQPLKQVIHELIDLLLQRAL